VHVNAAGVGRAGGDTRHTSTAKGTMWSIVDMGKTYDQQTRYPKQPTE